MHPRIARPHAGRRVLMRAQPLQQEIHHIMLEALSGEAESVAAVLHHAGAGTHQLDAPSCKESVEAGPQDALSSISCDHDIKPAALTVG